VIIAASLFIAQPVFAKSVSFTDARDTASIDSDLSKLGYSTRVRPDGEVRARFWLETYGGRVAISYLVIAIDSSGGPHQDRGISCILDARPYSCTMDNKPVGVGRRTVRGVERLFVYLPKSWLHATKAIRWRITSDNGDDDSSDAAPSWTGWYQS
jgi:hypothetical protein